MLSQISRMTVAHRRIAFRRRRCNVGFESPNDIGCRLISFGHLARRYNFAPLNVISRKEVAKVLEEILALLRELSVRHYQPISQSVAFQRSSDRLSTFSGLSLGSVSSSDNHP
jgi:hypothetical protein